MRAVSLVCLACVLSVVMGVALQANPEFDRESAPATANEWTSTTSVYAKQGALPPDLFVPVSIDTLEESDAARELAAVARAKENGDTSVFLEGVPSADVLFKLRGNGIKASVECVTTLSWE